MLFPVHEVLAQSDFHSIKYGCFLVVFTIAFKIWKINSFFFTLIFFAAHSDHDKVVKLG